MRSESTAPIVIGAISNLTGEGAVWGLNHQRGTLLALEELNARGGIKGREVRVVFEDSPGGLARNAVSAYRRLVDRHKVAIIFGPLMGDEILTVAPLAKRDRVFLVGATYMPDLPENVFSTWIDVEVESDLVARRIFEDHTSLAILSSEQSWEGLVGRRVQDTFQKLGGKVVALEEPSFESSDVRTEVLRALRGKPSAVFISSYFLLPLYAKELRRLSAKLPLFGIELDQTVVESCSGAVEGMSFIGPKSPDDTFQERFLARWGEPSGIPAAHSYDAANLLFKALGETNGSYSELVRFFGSLSDFDGITGVISRGTFGTTARTTWHSVRNNTVVEVGPSTSPQRGFEKVVRPTLEPEVLEYLGQ